MTLSFVDFVCNFDLNGIFLDFLLHKPFNQSWYRYVPQARERRAAKRHVVGFNECATLNKLRVTGLLIEINMLIIS